MDYSEKNIAAFKDFLSNCSDYTESCIVAM